MDRKTLRAFVLCTLAVACTGASERLLNVDLIAPLTVLNPLCRDIVFIGASMGAWVVFVMVFSRHVIIKHAHMLTIVSIVLVGCAVVAAFFASLFSSVLLYGCALALAMAGSVWVSAATILALCQLESPTLIACCLCLSLGVDVVVQGALGMLSSNAQLVAYFVLECGGLVSAHMLACSFLDQIADEPPRELTIRQPGSFITASNPAVICFFVFAFLAGFTLALGSVEGVPLGPSSSTLLGFLASAVLLLAVRKKTFVDFVSKVAALLTVAGLLLAISIGSTGFAFLSNAVMSMGNACFSVLFMLCVTAMCKRNPSGSPFAIAFSKLPQTVGICLGALVGHGANSVGEQHPELSALFLSGVLVAFVALCFAWISRYKFVDIIFNIQPLQKKENKLRIQEPQPQTLSIEDRCAKLASTHKLTKRESEILVMLAKGRNGKFIEDFYTVSYNTVKTHVKHIYAKLSVHSQQELIDLVERTAD